jgi:hypothetical protein
VNGHPTATATNLDRVLDPLLRWVGDDNRGGAGLLFISPLGEHMRYEVPIFPHVK